MRTINCETCSYPNENAVLAIITIEPTTEEGGGIKLVHHSIHKTGPRKHFDNGLGQPNCIPAIVHDFGTDDDYEVLGSKIKADMFAFRYNQKLYLIKADDNRIFSAHYARFTSLGYYAEGEIFGKEKEDLVEAFGNLL